MVDIGRRKPRIALALQGGGAHGAYAWGVVERLLEEDVELVGISGASAGAMNGAALAAGFAVDGIRGAVAGMERMWQTISTTSPLAPFDHQQFRQSYFEQMFMRSLEYFHLTSRYFSPHTPGLRSMDALRRAMSASVDLNVLNGQTALPLHISATHIPTGAAKMFTGTEVTLDSLMASACLPDLFAPVEVDGESYWDGGFTANPALTPLLGEEMDATDMIVVQITPFVDSDVSGALGDRTRRVSEIGFNACLLRDLKVLTELKEISSLEQCNDPRLKAISRINLHLISPPASIGQRGGASKIDMRWSVLLELRALGREAAEAWLHEDGTLMGKKSSMVEMPDEVAKVMA